MHPGSDVTKMGNDPLKLIYKAINQALGEIPYVIILLENMAGQGSTCGRTFEELKYILMVWWINHGSE